MSIPALSFALAAIAYALLLFLLLIGREAGQRGEWVMTAVASGALWGLGITVSVIVSGGESPLRIVYVADSLRSLLWVLCLSVALPGRPYSRSIKGALRVAAVTLTALCVLDFIFLHTRNGASFALLGLAVIGLLTIEQILRNATDEEKGVAAAFLWTVGGILVYDLYVFSDAVLLGRVNPNLWALRGFVAAVGVPFLLYAAKRHPDWSRTLFISREMVFYSATLTGIGLYFLAMALGAFVIRQQGEAWGTAVQAGYFVAAFAVLAFVLSSGHWKRKLRVFISKNFYRNRYDYREEWLRLIRTLSDDCQDLGLGQRSIRALCEIIRSGGGQLWLTREVGQSYEPFAAWQEDFPSREYSSDSSLVRFLTKYQWVIDTREYRLDPESYGNAFADDDMALLGNSVVVPLFHRNEMLGIARLSASTVGTGLNYEDHDLLKTAGRQVAAYLAHDIAREQLAETQKFEAYSKFSAFVVHDLKNLLAQQVLLVENSKKFQARPEFVADAIRTIDNGVQRMRRLLKQLKPGSSVARNSRVELNKVILKAVSSCADSARAPCRFADGAQCWVYADADQLTSVFVHLIQNAQEATSNSSPVTIELSRVSDDRVDVEIVDHGKGMSEEFMRKKLFKPFETTKGVSGMGIGVYQARELVRGLGGNVRISSQLNVGTSVTISLPLASTKADAAISMT